MKIEAYITLFFDPERNQTWSVCEDCISSQVFKYRSNGKWPNPDTGETVGWADYSMSGRIKAGCIPVEIRRRGWAPFRLNNKDRERIVKLTDDASIHNLLVEITKRQFKENQNNEIIPRRADEPEMGEDAKLPRQLAPDWAYIQFGRSVG